jgi:hypothetical protein
VQNEWERRVGGGLLTADPAWGGMDLTTGALDLSPHAAVVTMSDGVAAR